MRSRFFTLANSLFALLILCDWTIAQPASSPSPKYGYLRFWDMLPAESGQFEVRDLAKGGATVMTARPFEYL